MPAACAEPRKDVRASCTLPTGRGRPRTPQSDDQGNAIRTFRTKTVQNKDSTMTTKTKRSFSKIQPATITFTESVTSATTSKGVDYKMSQNATVAFENGDTVTRTVMGFGAAITGLKNLRKNRSVRVAVQRDGGSIRIVGAVREAAAAAA
jgi:citrate lyase alpha subunit